ncbi:ABC transporter substrate-binding protein [Clostridium sp. SHJSY1]|uniref:taurine ABC transporter substrate-binding protein n=1 Tax=Clostridium sp. SHJSY1 TaxID=2942483 RepID=UPI00287BC756|nr:ABC transporter substrate-binding protein [Clostridium sp. SHJSY1]
MKIQKNFISIILLVMLIFTLTLKTISVASIEVLSNGNNNFPSQVKIGYMPSPNEELLAKANGTIEKKFSKTKVIWKKFNTGREMITALTAGLIDIGTIGTPPAALGIANDLPFKIYFLHDIIGESEALVVKNDSGINSIDDLKGKKIATTFNSTSDYSLIKALQINKVNLSDVKLMDMEMPDIIKAWENNSIDGAYVWEPTKSKLLSNGGKIIITSAILANEGAITGEVGIVHNDFARKYPNFLKEYISVLNDSVHQYKQNQQESAESLSKELGIPLDETLKVMNEIMVLDTKAQTNSKYIGTKDTTGGLAKILKDTGDYLVTHNAINSSPSLSIYQEAILNNLYD